MEGGAPAFPGQAVFGVSPHASQICSGANQRAKFRRIQMEPRQNTGEWLSWLNRVRFHVITYLLAIILAIHQLTSFSLQLREILPAVLLWYTVAALYVILFRWTPKAGWHAPLQMGCDLLLVTGIVYATGGHESYFISLYLLAILMASVLFSRRGVFVTAGVSFVLLGAMVELTYYDVLPRTATAMPTARALRILDRNESVRFPGDRLSRQFAGSNTSAQRRRTAGKERRVGRPAGL